MYVGITDENWYQYLAARQPEEVNFWRPSPRQAFAALAPGEVFLFKLRAPRRAIVGGGFFVKFTRLPTSLAWMAFGDSNGAPNLDALRTAILSHQSDVGQQPDPDPEIGNIVLTRPFFFREEEWIPEPPDWPPHGLQQGKGYDSATSSEGAWLWSEVTQRLAGVHPEVFRPSAPAERVRGWALRRVGQGSFRVLVTDAYGRRCAVTGEHTLPVLEAAHIRPVAASGSNEVRNGILLRADLHILFDRGYVTFDEMYRFVVSPRLEAEYHNGRDYYARLGRPILLPDSPNDRPAPEFLAWHRDHVFVA